MTLVKDINELPLKPKTIVLSVAALMPFWYIALYLFHKPFMANNPLHTILIFAFAFALVWYVANIACVLVVSWLVRRELEVITLLVSSGIASLLYLCIIICLCYYFEWKFIQFLILAFAYIPLRFVSGLIARMMATKRQAETKQPEENSYT